MMLLNANQKAAIARAWAENDDPHDAVLAEMAIYDLAEAVRQLPSAETVIDDAVAALQRRHDSYLDVLADVRKDLASGEVRPAALAALADLAIGLSRMGEDKLARRVLEVGALVQTPAASGVAS